jgi:hypothetical protein
MTELSPRAEAILNAVTFTRYDAPYFACPKSIDQIRLEAAGVLRAAANEVVPVEPEPPALPFPSVNDPWPHWDTKQAIRRQLLAIAAELEGQP